MVPRSYLFVPADRPERYAKAQASGADAVIVDLEDAIAANAKGVARWPSGSTAAAHRPVVVRVNAVGSLELNDDIAACRAGNVQAIRSPRPNARRTRRALQPPPASR